MGHAPRGYSPSTDAALIKRVMRVRAMLIAEGHGTGNSKVLSILATRFQYSIPTIQRIIKAGEGLA